MSYEYPSVIDFAYQIIALHEENQRLLREVEHYKSLHEMNCRATNESIEHGERMIGTLLMAAIDPDSVINRGHRAMLAERMREQMEGGQ